jgi:hypothetical protein
MPHYKAIVQFKAKNADFTDTMPVIIEANNAIHAKAILQDRYGDDAVKSVTRDQMDANSSEPKDERAGA